MADRSTTSRPQRWDSPFDTNMGDPDVTRMLLMSPFSEMDPARFPSNLPLDGIVRNDTRIRRYERGEIIVRAGDYGNSAFLIIAGDVGVILPPGLSADSLGHSETLKHGVWSALMRYFKKSVYPEVRHTDGKYITNEVATKGSGEFTRVFLKDTDKILAEHDIATLTAGNMFGEVAAMARVQRNASVVALEDVELLEIRWQALRDIRRQVDSFRLYIDNLYRKQNLITHLKEIEVFQFLDDDAIAEITKHTLFESYGNFDWHTSFKRKKSAGQLTPGAEESPIVAEGDYPDGLLFVRSGFAKITKRINNGSRAVSILSQGGIFGLEEILHNSQHAEPIAYQTGLNALGYADILRVPTSIIEQIVIPSLPENLFETMESKLQFSTQANLSTTSHTALDSDFLEFSVDNRFINGTATMMIDLDRCVRCDECVHACASTHQGNPRFARHGKQHDNQMITNACMHCVDPVCMIGCPTGAIHRSELGGEVVISDQACIGCGTCANSCPYDNIRLVEVRSQEGTILIDEKTRTPILKATKCDLCYNLPHGPACENACPHGALVRMNMSDSVVLSEWLNK